MKFEEKEEVDIVDDNSEDDDAATTTAATGAGTVIVNVAIDAAITTTATETNEYVLWHPFGFIEVANHDGDYVWLILRISTINILELNHLRIVAKINDTFFSASA